MVYDAADLEDQRSIIDACLRYGVPFTWHGPGTLLIHSRGIPSVTEDLILAGYRILGIEGFDVDPRIGPRLDLILDNSDSPVFRDSIAAAGLWTDDVWVDLAITRARDMDTETIEKPTAAGPIAIYLSPDEALVLDAYLSRASKSHDYGSIEDQAELRVLWDLGAILESRLIPPLQPGYLEHLARARAAVRDSTE